MRMSGEPKSDKKFQRETLQVYIACRFAEKNGFSALFGRAALCAASHVVFFNGNML